MPIHEYVCRSCGEELERLQKLSDAPLTDCPACGETALKRKMSAASFRLAGGGWYETDFKSEGRRNIAGDGDDKAGTKDAAEQTSGGAEKTDQPKQAANGNKSDKAAASPSTSKAGADSA